jgi:phage shock protein PspC (stress-responsive transcriptional regulator)
VAARAYAVSNLQLPTVVRLLFVALGVSVVVCVSLSAALYVVAWKIAERRRWPRS